MTPTTTARPRNVRAREALPPGPGRAPGVGGVAGGGGAVRGGEGATAAGAARAQVRGVIGGGREVERRVLARSLDGGHGRGRVDQDEDEGEESGDEALHDPVVGRTSS